MATFKSLELELEHKFDPKSCRHTLNGAVTVLHCHHYMTLYTQLAEDCALLDAKKLIAEVMEDTVREALDDYYSKHGITDLRDRFAIAEEYYAACGLGAMTIAFAGADSAEAVLAHSHLDEGWIKKWGKRDPGKPVNWVTCGFIAAALAAAFGKPPRSYAVTETQSIVCGDAESRFTAVAS